MTRGVSITLTMGMMLALACARGGDLRLERAGELQAEYVDRKQDIDGCMQVFGECLAGAPDAGELADCAADLATCLETAEEVEDAIDEDTDGLPPGVDTEDDPFGQDTEGENDEDVEDEDDEGLGGVCEPLLDMCLDDPGNFDPFCLDDFEQCVQVQIALELEELCDEVVAECLALEIPNYDCFDVCP